MNQFSKAADEQLNRLSSKIADGQELIDKGTVLKNEAWEEVFELFEEFGREGKAARFLARDGHYLYKQPHDRGQTLREGDLWLAMVAKYGERKARRLWNLITEPKVSSVLLEAAVQNHTIDAALVASCIDKKEDTFDRIRKEWTKDDHNRAVVLGIQKEGSWQEQLRSNTTPSA